VLGKVTLTMLLLFVFLAPAHGVENGIEIAGDPNAVAVNGAGGFLYSPRIVLTTAHNHILPHEINDIEVGLPGQPWTSNSTKIHASKVFLASTFNNGNFRNGGNIFSRTDDFAVIVLDKPMKMNDNVKIASQEQINKYKLDHEKVSMVGYGLQSSEMRIASNNGQNSIDIYPKIIKSNFITDNEAQTIFKVNMPSNAIFNMDAYFAQNLTTGTVCDNDSGSGWFVEQANIRYYIGAQSAGWGFPNCGKDGIWGASGTFAAVSAAYKFMDLILEAEKYVEANPYLEPTPTPTPMPTLTSTPTNTTDLSKSKISVGKTLKCVKGKSVKVIKSVNPKCPKGYLVGK